MALKRGFTLIKSAQIDGFSVHLRPLFVVIGVSRSCRLMCKQDADDAEKRIDSDKISADRWFQRTSASAFRCYPSPRKSFQSRWIRTC